MYALLVLLVSAQTVRSTLTCNGLVDLCDLRINQATFPGTHNSGSGFDGVMKYWSGGHVSSCFYRNQGQSFTGQLDFGIRYFDIDTCYGNGKALNCHCPGSGKNCAYAGSVRKALLQIDSWMKTHPSEVVVIHFNRDAQIGYRQNIAQDILSILLDLWDPASSTGLAMSTYYHTNNQWPKLREAMQSKQRIFIFMDNNLGQHISNHDWLHSSNSFIRSTWATQGVSSSCSGITSSAKSKCATNRYTFIELSAFASYGLCTWDMATLCSKWLGEAQSECYKLRSAYGLTVNFLTVDWATDYYSGGESVVNKAKFMNQKNIQQYLQKSIFFPELTGCAYHAGWFYNYCWKYCAEYGWCWVNKYCGQDSTICQKSDFPCYSSCG